MMLRIIVIGTERQTGGAPRSRQTKADRSPLCRGRKDFFLEPGLMPKLECCTAIPGQQRQEFAQPCIIRSDVRAAPKRRMAWRFLSYRLRIGIICDCGGPTIVTRN